MALTPKVASYMYNYGVSIGKEQDYSCPEEKEPVDTTVVVDPKDQTEIVVEEPKKPNEQPKDSTVVVIDTKQKDLTPLDGDDWYK